MKQFLQLGFVLIVLTSLMAGCTDNQRAKQWGGTMKVELPEGEKLVEATWKADQLWYLTRPRKGGEAIDTFTFREESSFGMVEGKVIFIEK